MTPSLLNDTTVLWRPRNPNSTQLQRFKEHVNAVHSIDLKTYQELHAWSVENHATFWEDFWHYSGIVCSRSYDEVIETAKSMQEIPRWFDGARLNYAENVFARGAPDRVAIYAAGEGAEAVQRLTFAELRTLVGRLAAAMRRMGVGIGDRVAGYLPNCPEAVAAMLATSSIGAIWSSTSPDFGVSGVLDRFGQIEPKLLFSVNAVRYNGKLHDHMDKLEKVANGLPHLEKAVVLTYVSCSKQLDKRPDIRNVRNSCHFDDFCATLDDAIEPELEFAQLPFDHPLYIMYSSGTTGVPKCMVHSQGGTLIKHLEEHMLQGNVSADDIMLYYTTTGWMMWNWLVSVLAVGAAIVLYDGSPLVPKATVLWDLVDELGITILGTGAKWISVIESLDLKPVNSHKLNTLHTILSTGSPLKPQSFDYVYKYVKPDVLLASITGGTDIIGVFAGINPCLPVHRGEIQSVHLGMAVESWDEDGKRVFGDRGELVCTKPFPSMPVYFWNDETGQKYRKSYFGKFPGVWAHGDFCLMNPSTMGLWMLGRSDGTLNPNGVRFGSSEIYHIVESLKEVVDSVCVAQRNLDNTEERVVLFLKMASDGLFNEDLLRRLRVSIRTLLSARHVPEVILETKDIPYTISGKKVEVAVRDTIGGQPVLYTSALANPAALDLYKNIPELQGY